MPVQPLILRCDKGSPLTIAEMDANLELISFNQYNANVYSSSNSNAKGGDNNYVGYGYNSTVIGGYSNSNYCTYGSTILGGDNNYSGYNSYSTILGGRYNYISNYSNCSSILGGRDNTVSFYSSHSTILGGYSNEMFYSGYSSVSGYQNQMRDQYYSSIVGGRNNLICGYYSYYFFSGLKTRGNSIVGGRNHYICQADYSAILAGRNNCIGYCGHYSAIVGGRYNTIEDNNSYYATILGGSFNCMRYSVCDSSIVGGYSNYICYYSYQSSILGGVYNRMYYAQQSSIISSSQNNSCGYVGIKYSKNSQIAASYNSFIYGNYGYGTNCSKYNSIMGSRNSFIGKSCASSVISSINRSGKFSNGLYNSIASSIIAHETCYNSSLVATIYDSANSVILGGRSNTQLFGYALGSTTIYRSENSLILGGQDNLIENQTNSQIINGCMNKICTNNSYYRAHNTILNGCYNIIRDSGYSTIIGGYANCIGNNYNMSNYSSYHSTIIGGYGNKIGKAAPYSTIIGSCISEIICSPNSSIMNSCGSCIYDSQSIGRNTIIGGRDNKIFQNVYDSMIIGGYKNNIAGNGCYNNVILGGSNLTLNGTSNTILFCKTATNHAGTNYYGFTNWDGNIGGVNISVRNGIITSIM